VAPPRRSSKTPLFSIFFTYLEILFRVEFKSGLSFFSNKTVCTRSTSKVSNFFYLFSYLFFEFGVGFLFSLCSGSASFVLEVLEVSSAESRFFLFTAVRFAVLGKLAGCNL